MTVTIYHNPKCGTSRNVLAILREKGIEPDIVEYMKTPLGKDELKSLFGKMSESVRDVLREKGTPFEELNLSDPNLSDDELLDFIVEHPILLNRPIVVTAKRAKLCRPSETVLELLD